MADVHYKETAYGFEYGAASITRCCSDKKQGWVDIRIETPRTEIELYVTKTGKVRVYKKGKELK